MIDDWLATLKERLDANPPATEDLLERANKLLGQFADEGYLSFLRSMDGAEGDAGDEFGYVQLWQIDDLKELNAAYCTSEFLTDVFLIGSNGGEEAYGLAIRGGTVVAIAVPFIPMGDAEVRVVAPSFGGLVAQIAGAAEQ